MANQSVPLLDLKAQYESIREEVVQVVERVMRSQMFILGPEVTGLESEIAAYCQAKHCIGVTSGSDALLMALMALDVGPGDEVITTPYTFFATAGAVARLGATPVFVDIEPESFNIDPSKIEAQITPRTRAIIPVHLYGQCADMDPILEIGARHGVPVIEDAAQAIGAEYKGRRAGSMGAMSCFSFFPSKNLGAFGDAGALTTNDDALAEKLFSIRVHGYKVRYYHHMIGGNFRIDALQAAILRVKLKYLDQWTVARQRNAHFYNRAFAERGLTAVVTPPKVAQDRHVFNQYVIRATDRDELRASMQAQGVGCEIYYPLPLHRQECFAYLDQGPADFKESELAAATSLALPIYPELTSDQRHQVVDAIASYYASTSRQTRRTAA